MSRGSLLVRWFPGIIMTLLTPANQSQRWHFRAAAKPPGNFLTQYPLEMSEAQAGNRTYPKWQQARLSHSSSLHYFSALGLPSCQGGNGHEGPDCMSWLCREQESGPCLQTSHHVQKNRCAAQSCRALSHQSLCCTDSQGQVKPRTLPIFQVLSPHVAAAKHWPPGKHWISATVQHLLFCRDAQM